MGTIQHSSSISDDVSVHFVSISLPKIVMGLLKRG